MERKGDVAPPLRSFFVVQEWAPRNQRFAAQRTARYSFSYDVTLKFVNEVRLMICYLSNSLFFGRSFFF